MIVFAPVVLILTFAEQVLVKVGQDPTVSKYAQIYLNAYLPALILFGYIDQQQRFLNMFRLNYIPLIFQIIGQAFHIGICYCLLRANRVGVTEVGLASSMTNLLMYIGMLIYSSRVKLLERAI